MKRGLSPIIGTILLIMVIVSLGAFVAYWTYGYSDKSFSSIENVQSFIQLSDEGKVNIIHTDYNSLSDTLSLTLRNSGGKSIALDNSSKIPTTNWIITYTNGRPICETTWSGSGSAPTCYKGCGRGTELDIGDIRNVDLNLSGSACSLREETNNTIFFVTVSFSGKATSSTTFEKVGNDPEYS